MFDSILTKTLYDKRNFLLGWLIGAVALLALTAAFFPTIKNSNINQLFKSIPPALQNMVGNVNDYNTFKGYVGTAVFGLRAQMIFIPLAIILGISLGHAPEASGKLYQLLAQPVSRRRVAVQQWLAGMVIILTIVAVVTASMVLVAAAIHEPVPWGVLARLGIMSFLFTFMVFSITYGLGIGFGRKSLAISLPVAWVIASFLIDSLAPELNWVRHLESASMLTYYHTSSLIHGTINTWHVVVTAAVSGVSLITGMIFFTSRDLREED